MQSFPLPETKAKTKARGRQKRKVEKLLEGLVVFHQLIPAEKMDPRRPRSHDPQQSGGWEGGRWMIEDKEMLQSVAANPHVFKINRHTTFPQLS